MYDDRIQNLIEKIKAYAPNADIDKVVRAYNLAKEKVWRAIYYPSSSSCQYTSRYGIGY